MKTNPPPPPDGHTDNFKSIIAVMIAVIMLCSMTMCSHTCAIEKNMRQMRVY